MKNMPKITTGFCQEPYRLFFPLGIVMGIWGVGHWLFYGAGWSAGYSGFFHSSVQVWLYMGCFAGGFLMTAIPRFSSTFPARPFELVLALGLVLAEFVFLTVGRWVLAEICFAGWLLFLLFFIFRRFRAKPRGVRPPDHFVWIGVGILHALGGAVILILCQKEWVGIEKIEIGRSMIEQGFLLSLVCGVGGFLGPRLMGSCAPVVLRWPAHLLAAFLLFLSFWIEGHDENPAGYALRAFVVTVILFVSGALLFKPRAPQTLFTRLLSLSFWMVSLGLWAAVSSSKHHVTFLHLLFIGGFSLMTFCVATMVVLNHSGQGQRLARPLWILKVIGLGLLSALALRLGTIFFTEIYFQLLAAASALWLCVGAAWLVFFFTLKQPVGSFKHSHGEAC
jgi:uncharacterized protein involved in response to NO